MFYLPDHIFLQTSAAHSDATVSNLCVSHQLAVSIGNTRFNDIMEAGLPNDSVKPLPQSDMWVQNNSMCFLPPPDDTLLIQAFFLKQPRNARKEYIVAKYAERRYVVHKEEADPCRLHNAVKSRDLNSLLQLYAEGVDLSKPLTLPEGQVSATSD